MSLQVDPEVLEGLSALARDEEPPPVGDVVTRRLNAGRIFEQVLAVEPAVEGVDVAHYTIPVGHGAVVQAHWYHPRTSNPPGSAALYLHGGGMIMGLEQLGRLYDFAVRHYVASSGVPMLMVDYRVAPEFAHPVPAEDGYAALLWLVDHAQQLGVDAARLAVMGDSAGGGIAAAVCLMARDRGGPPIAQQLLVYPMLDDRPQKREPAIEELLTWTSDDNLTGWAALLGKKPGAEEVSPYAAPARAVDLSDLPATYIDVGDLDIFHDEDVAYARRLESAGVPTELHVYPGCPHAFEWLAPRARVTQGAIAERVRRLRSL